MSSKVIYERFLWFHKRIKEEKYPNTKTLSEEFDISRKTAQRDIEFLSERFRAPLVYVHGRRGYSYEDNTWEIPGLWLNEGELISLVLSSRLASAVPDSGVKTSLKTLLNQIIAHHSSGTLSIDELSERISVKNIAYAQTNEAIFHRLLEALLRMKALRIEYFSPHSNQNTTRDILPLHLLNYMGTWHIIAYCNVKKELRDFVLSRIRSAAACETPVDVSVPAAKVKNYIRDTFGIFRGEKSRDVCLRFTAEIAPWIAEQSWHPKQIIRIEKNGRLLLTIPVADFREIKREILRYGAQVEVVSPKALREEVKKEIQKMKIIYS
jgi:predicted DNA-binding transcriptional regulator YafY